MHTTSFNALSCTQQLVFNLSKGFAVGTMSKKVVPLLTHQLGAVPGDDLQYSRVHWGKKDP